MHRPVLFLIHAPWETPALIQVALGETPSVVRSILSERTPALPALDELGGLVVMGGPQDANDDSAHPGLVAERRLLAEAVSAEVPVIGVCLGMQLLGLALGAKLHLRHGKEIGFGPVEWTEAAQADPIVSVFAQQLKSSFLHWHTDAVELPVGATLLASTPVTPVQAFRQGSALGLQFHPEADIALVNSWLSTPEMVHGLGSSEVGKIWGDADVHLPALRPIALVAFGAFTAAVEARRNR